MSKIPKFNININCVVIGTDIPNNKQYILSTNDKNIEFPIFELNISHKNDIDSHITNFLKQHVFVNELELMPQIINLNSEYITTHDQSDINVIYGFVIKYTTNINNSYWISFDYAETIPYSNLIFEVIQKLK